MTRLALGAIFLLALFLRVYFPWTNVYTPDGVMYQETDAWHHARVVTNLLHHFPAAQSV